MASALSDHRDQFCLVVQLLRDPWAHDGLSMCDQRGSTTHEEGRVLWFGMAAFPGMIGVVQAQADDLAGTSDGDVITHAGRVDVRFAAGAVDRGSQALHRFLTRTKHARDVTGKPGRGNGKIDQHIAGAGAEGCGT